MADSHFADADEFLSPLITCVAIGTWSCTLFTLAEGCLPASEVRNLTNLVHLHMIMMQLHSGDHKDLRPNPAVRTSPAKEMTCMVD